MLAAAVMALARVYIGAHYVHDMLVGLALGAAFSGLGFVAARPAPGSAAGPR